MKCYSVVILIGRFERRVKCAPFRAFRSSLILNRQRWNESLRISRDCLCIKVNLLNVKNYHECNLIKYWMFLAHNILNIAITFHFGNSSRDRASVYPESIENVVKIYFKLFFVRSILKMIRDYRQVCTYKSTHRSVIRYMLIIFSNRLYLNSW